MWFACRFLPCRSPSLSAAPGVISATLAVCCSLRILQMEKVRMYNWVSRTGRFRYVHFAGEFIWHESDSLTWYVYCV